MTFIELMKKFPTENSVIQYYLTIRYPNGVCCNHCGSSNKVYQEKERPKVFSCNDCKSTFSPFKDTIFEKSSTDLRKWMYAIHMFLNGKKGISGLQLQREIGVTYKTAWRMLHQIRKAMGNAESKEFFDTIVEIDETYVGGKPRKGNKRKDDDDKGTPIANKRGRGTNKTPVVGIINRNEKKVYAKVAMPNKEGKKLSAKQLIDILNNVSKQDNNNTIITDEFRGYDTLSRNNFIHLRVDHSRAFSNGKGIHTNNIESFWATLKRGVYGIYHHISVEYMQKYVDEFCFRYNNREDNMFDMVLKQSILKV